MPADFKCPFCGKVYKTEKRFQGHTCLKKERYDNFNMFSYMIWKMWNKSAGIKLSTSDEKNRMRFIGAKEYKIFEDFSLFIQTKNPPDVVDYIKWLVNKKIDSRYWKVDSYYHRWLIEFIKSENRINAIVRSKQFMEQQSLKLEDLSESRLYNYLYNGRISPWYVSYIDKTIFLKMGDDLLSKIQDIVSVAL